MATCSKAGNASPVATISSGAGDQQVAQIVAGGEQADAQASSRAEPSSAAVATMPICNGLEADLRQIGRQDDDGEAVAEGANGARRADMGDRRLRAHDARPPVAGSAMPTGGQAARRRQTPTAARARPRRIVGDRFDTKEESGSRPCAYASTLRALRRAWTADRLAGSLRIPGASILACAGSGDQEHARGTGPLRP